jgi:hypothetical protein
MEEKQIKFECWAIVELFGHSQLAGKVTTEVIADQSFIRIEVPETSMTPGFTKYHLPSAVYGMTPVDKEYAVKYAEKLNAQPVNDYKHNEVIKEMVNAKLHEISQKSLEGGF